MLKRDEVIQILKEIPHPQIPVNIWDLGLIYEIEIGAAEDSLKILMTLTGENKTTESSLHETVKSKLADRIKDVPVNVEITFIPPWNPDHMNDDARKKLGIEA